jgi:hypothetical protein
MSKSKKTKFGNKKQLQEMPMQFDNPRDVKPHPSIQNNLANNNTPLKKIPFPKVGHGSVASNFQELLASERYKEVLDKVKNYTGLQSVPENQVPTLMHQMMAAYESIVRLERQHKPELERLAVELVHREMGVNEGDINYDGKIVGLHDIDAAFHRNDQETDDVQPDIDNEDEDDEEQPQGGQPDVEEIGDEEHDEDAKIESQLFNRLKDLNLERAKRRFINAMIQGASKRGHYMYHLVADRLRELTGSDALLNAYGVMMSVNDLLYWMIPDQYVDRTGLGRQGMEGGGRRDVQYRPDQDNLNPRQPHIGDQMMGAQQAMNNPAGSEETDRNTEVPTVRARAFCFPVLLHELIKGTMEIISYHGVPEDEEMFHQINNTEDVLSKEFWDFRLGPAIWARLRNMIPEDILTDDNQKELQNYLFMEFFSLPAKEFLIFAREVVGNTTKGARLMKELCDEAAERLRNADDADYDYGQSNFRRDLDSMKDDLSDDDIDDDWLKSLGISRPKDDDDE